MKTEIQTLINNRFDLISRYDAIVFLKSCGYDAIQAIKITKNIQIDGYLGRLS